jgi:hypothetical protein
MNEERQFEGAPGPRKDHTRLAQWLQGILHTPSQSPQQADPTLSASRTSPLNDHERSLELLFDENYHLHYYQQLPDFIMALLTNEPQATLTYASLLYHLAGCDTCHAAYLELYDALRAAVKPLEPRPLLGQGTRTLEATPPRMLSHLCQTFVSQAETVLLQARHDHVNADDTARTLLQSALRISARIGQNKLRQEALHDLVRVATLFDGATSPEGAQPGVQTYVPLIGGSSVPRRKRTVRGVEAPLRGGAGSSQEHLSIRLQAKSLEGSISQDGRMLQLHLLDLNPALRAQYISVSVLLGGLVEPVHWLGGNPHAIRSATRVDETGSITMSLGETDLQLAEPEEYRLLEAMFLLLEVRAAT